MTGPNPENAQELFENVIETDSNLHIGCYGTRFFGDIVITKAHGHTLEDHNGKTYIDCVSGIASISLGHNNPSIESAVAKYKAENGVDHVSNLFYTKAQADLLHALAEVSPIDNPRFFFCNSGAEATNGAIKLASKNGGEKKPNLAYFLNSFHGRYSASLAATGQVKYQHGFEKILPGGTIIFPYNDTSALKGLTDSFYAVILELVEAEGGIIPATQEFIDSLVNRCSETGTMIIVDEVQTGIGRTGEMFACNHYGLKPDAICMAKGIANGYPFGAVAFGEKIYSMIKPGEHASTFGGNPEGCIRATAVIQALTHENVLENVNHMEEVFKSYKFEDLPGVTAVRGKGLLLGVEMESADLRKRVIEYSKENGALFCGCGASVVRIVPPLNIPEREFRTAMKTLYAAIR